MKQTVNSVENAGPQIWELRQDGELHVRVELMNANIIRISNAEPEAIPSAAVTEETRARFAAEAEAVMKQVRVTEALAEETQDGVLFELVTPCMALRVGTDMRTAFYDHNGAVLCEDFAEKRSRSYELDEDTVEDAAVAEHHASGVSEDYMRLPVCCVKRMQGAEAFYGCGDKTGFLNKRGYEYVNWNTDDWLPHVDSMKALYKSIPFFITKLPYGVFGIFFDNPYKSYMDFGKENSGYYFFGADNGILDYYFIYGETMAEVLRHYTALTGRMPRMPRWALGYHQSRWGYASQREIEEIGAKLRALQIPCDAIHMDIDYMDGYRVFTWDKRRFPEPEAYVENMHRNGFKLVTIVDPGVKRDEQYKVYCEGAGQGHFAKEADTDSIYINEVWPGESAYPNFTEPRTRKWWGGLHQFSSSYGIDGIWNDMNEPASFRGPLPDDVRFSQNGVTLPHARVHNVYGHYMAEATYNGLKQLTGKRPFVITRACYAGTQRYSVVWTGDNHSIWAHLQMAVPQLCNLGLSGMAFAGTDIGGFSADATAELLCRWIEMACFSPLCRNHSSKGTRRQEPWQFDEATVRIYRKFVTLRYRYLPYLYDTMLQCAESGMPMLRPLVLMYEQDENTWNCNDEFMVGDSLLVAPVLTQGSTCRSVYLPEGMWYDISHGTECAVKVKGGQNILAYAPLDTCPMYVREGSILPVYPPMQYTDERPVDELVLEVYGGEAEYIHTVDNGTDFAYKTQQAETVYRLVYRNGALHTELVRDGWADGKYRNIRAVRVAEKNKED